MLFDFQVDFQERFVHPMVHPPRPMPSVRRSERPRRSWRVIRAVARQVPRPRHRAARAPHDAPLASRTLSKRA